MTNAICGRRPSNAFAQYDRDSRFWRTFQASFQHPTGEPFSETWPKQGMQRDGWCLVLTIAVPITGGSGCGYWPTPNVPNRGPERRASKQKRGSGGVDLQTAVQQFPTPSARDWKASNATGETMQKNSRPLNETVTGGAGGQLNPTWVEWLMGWPIGWTDLKPLGMDRFQSWLRQHSESLREIFSDQ